MNREAVERLLSGRLSTFKRDLLIEVDALIKTQLEDNLAKCAPAERVFSPNPRVIDIVLEHVPIEPIEAGTVIENTKNCEYLTLGLAYKIHESGALPQYKDAESLSGNLSSYLSLLVKKGSVMRVPVIGIVAGKSCHGVEKRIEKAFMAYYRAKP